MLLWPRWGLTGGGLQVRRPLLLLLLLLLLLGSRHLCQLVKRVQMLMRFPLLLLLLLSLCWWQPVLPRVLLVLCCRRDGLIINALWLSRHVLCDLSISRHLMTPSARGAICRVDWL